MFSLVYGVLVWSFVVFGLSRVVWFENGISVCGGRISFLAAEFKLWLLLCVEFNT